MKLKYYFRGIGIGVVVTTLVFMILISIHKNDGVQGTDAVMQDTESRTVAQLQAGTQNPSGETEEQKASGEEKKQQDTEASREKEKQQDTEASGEKGKQQEKETSGKEKKQQDTKASGALQKTPENPAGGEKPDAQKPAEPADNKAEPAVPESGKEEKVRIEISGGQFSDVVCRKLEEAGLVDSAKAFNDYLVEKDYDNAILPGVYEIPKDATYEEIAVLLTTRV